MAQIIKVIAVNGNNWKIPVNFAIALHAIFILGTIYGPQILSNKPLVPEVYTIDIINISESTPQPPQPKPIAPKEVVKLKPPEPKAAPVLEQEILPEPDPVEVKPVSIKPLKRKKIKKIVKKPRIDQRKRLENIKKQREKAAADAEKKAEEAARLAAQEAVEQLKNLIQETQTIQKEKPANPAPPSNVTQKKSVANTILTQYSANFRAKIEPHWSLPEYKQWDENISAILVLVVTKNGTIKRNYFEKKSGDDTFDKFVIKAIENSVPLPPFPEALNKQQLEMVLEFVPGAINN